jgi:predicted secreted hydrolase
MSLSGIFAKTGISILLIGLTAIMANPQWRQASRDYELSFPKDFASHPEYRIEWWYYTGNLRSADGNHWGYQLTFFRIGIDFKPENPSKWAVRDLFMAHLAVTDIDGQNYRFAERLNRAGPGWAGADTELYRVWNEDWEATLDAQGRHRLRARDKRMGLDLTLESLKLPVLHGDRGHSQKGSQEGNASHYYSLTRMSTQGEIQIEGETIPVEGLSWMDHEFGTSFLEEQQVGWDWFSIQLDDGSELMLFQLRREDGSIDPRSSGTLVDVQVGKRSIGASQFELTPGQRWRSADSGAEYPTEWTIQIPDQRIVLNVKAALANQELRTERSTGVTYWEGAVEISGVKGGKAVRGLGYLEMTGYAGESMGRIFR